MKKIKKRYLFTILGATALCVVGFSAGIGERNRVDIHGNYIVKEPQLATVAADHNSNVNKFLTPPLIGKSFIGFKEALAYRESRGNYFVVNPYGYVGKYQFGKTTLRHYGVRNVDEFLNSPELQEKLLLVSLQRSKWVLRNEINQFVGKEVNGIYITESGILAAAHLAGVNSVKKFFKYQGNYTFADANGTTLQNYLKKFAGYDLDFVQAKEKPILSK